MKNVCSFLVYEVWWVSLHTLTTAVGCLTLYLVHCFPAAYNHLLHRTSLYLGNWAKVASTQTVIMLVYIFSPVSRSRVASPPPSTASGPRPVCGQATPSCVTARIYSGRKGSSTPPSPAILVTPGQRRYIAPQMMSRWGIVERSLG